MRSLRPSFTVALFAGSFAAIACAGGDDDDDKSLTSSDAAVTAQQPGTGGLDSGAAPAAAPDAGLPPNPANPFGGGGDSGFGAIISSFLDGGDISMLDPNLICQFRPQSCVNGVFVRDGGATTVTGDSGTTTSTTDGGTTTVRDAGIPRRDAGGLAGFGGLAGAGGMAAGGAAAGIDVCAIAPQFCMGAGGTTAP